MHRKALVHNKFKENFTLFGFFWLSLSRFHKISRGNPTTYYCKVSTQSILNTTYYCKVSTQSILNTTYYCKVSTQSILNTSKYFPNIAPFPKSI
jgi:hypothetical protein